MTIKPQDETKSAIATHSMSETIQERMRTSRGGWLDGTEDMFKKVREKWVRPNKKTITSVQYENSCGGFGTFVGTNPRLSLFSRWKAADV